MINQPTINITDVDGKDWGERVVTQLNWDKNDTIYCIIIDWYANGGQTMAMYLENDGKYYNTYKNLFGTL